MFNPSTFDVASKFGIANDDIVLWSISGKRIRTVKLFKSSGDKWPLTYTRLQYYVNQNYTEPPIENFEIHSTNPRYCEYPSVTFLKSVSINGDAEISGADLAVFNEPKKLTQVEAMYKDDTPCFNVIINWDYNPQSKYRLVQKEDHIIIIELKNKNRMPKQMCLNGICVLCKCSHSTILSCKCGNIIHSHQYCKYVDYYDCCHQTAIEECQHHDMGSETEFDDEVFRCGLHDGGDAAW